MKAAQQEQTTIEVNAFSERHAKFVAASTLGKPVDYARSIITNRNPMPGSGRSNVKIENFPARGARQWDTVYNIYTFGMRVAVGDDVKYAHKEFVTGDIESKTEALQVARDLADKHGMPMVVHVEKKVREGSSETALITPNKKPGLYTVHTFEEPEAYNI